jgi:5-methylcytosine-specific restriction endonuclease McrA
MSRKRKPISNKVRLAIWEKYNKKCAYCGCDLAPTKKEAEVLGIESLQIDHSIHVWRDRRFTEEQLNSEENLLPVCGPCNRYKKSKGLEGYRKFLLKLNERIMKTPCCFFGMKYGILSVSKWDGKFYFEKINE